MNTNFPQLDSSWFFSQSFWFLVLFLFNFILHSVLIIPLLQKSVFGFIKKKNLLKKSIESIQDSIESNQIQIEEINLQSKNFTLDAHLKAEEKADQELLASIHQIRESTNKKRQELKQSFSENKKNFIKTFSGSISELSDIICSKMGRKDG